MTNYQLTILFFIVATLCTILHFILGTIVVSIAGTTLFGVWSGAGAWCSWVGLANVAVFWISCIQLSRLFDENLASARLDRTLVSLRDHLNAVNAINKA